MVEHIVLHYSPWIALGLSKGSTPTDTEAKAAFRGAIIQCHPDKRNRFGIPSDRWPTTDHLQDSLTYFADLRNKGILSTLYPPDNFAQFPRTFHPQHPPGNAGVYTEASVPGFFTCTVCCMVTKAAFRDEHLISHNLSTCQFCDEIISECGLLEHYHHQHDICQPDIESLLTYIRQCHTCAYCHQCFIDIQAHVDSEHRCDCRIEDASWEKHIHTHHICCATYHRDLTQHFLESHPCQCRTFQNNIDFPNHVIQDHICPHCGKYNIDLKEHLSLAHFCQHCIEFQQDLPMHVVSKHKCSYCLDLTVDLDGHIQTTHKCDTCGAKLKDLDEHVKSHLCEKCGTSHTNIQSHLRKHCKKCDFVARDPSASLLKHLFGTHCLTLCDNCSLVLPVNKDLWKHINESHSWVPCPLCEVLIDEVCINYHLAQSHEWERCES